MIYIYVWLRRQLFNESGIYVFGVSLDSHGVLKLVIKNYHIFIYILPLIFKTLMIIKQSYYFYYHKKIFLIHQSFFMQAMPKKTFIANWMRLRFYLSFRFYPKKDMR